MNKHASIFNSNEIPSDLMGLDIGPETIDQFSKIILDSGTILWNGPMGVFEVDGFHKGTQKIAESISRATKDVNPKLLLVVEIQLQQLKNLE